MNFVKLKTFRDNKIYFDILKKMTAEQKLLKMFELSEYANKLFLQGLKIKYPELNDDEIKKIYLKRLKKCYNRNY